MQHEMLMTTEAESAEVIRCIDACERCHRACLHTAMTYCLEQGSGHIEPPHFRLMISCAAMCRTTADAMLSALALYEELCALCARICNECAASCRALGEMDECAEVCSQCAEACLRICGLAPHRSEAKMNTADMDFNRGEGDSRSLPQ